MFGSNMEFETTMAVESVVHTSQQRAHGVGTPSRHEKSLGLLTVKFVSLLQEAEDGVLDLKVAADSLAVRQKRRIYDITNVLEGVGLIEKKNKNMIQWRGETTACQSKEVQGQLEALKAQISELEVQEKELDNQKAWLEENIAHLKHDPISRTYKFVTHEDICNAFSGETLLAVVAPSGTQLEVPLPETALSGQKKYQVNLRSHTAPIQVMLINRESESSKPLVFSVPPVCSAMPTPPSTPTSLQRVPLPAAYNSFSSATESSSFTYSQDSSFCSDHQMVLPEHDDMLTPSSTPPDAQMDSASLSVYNDQHHYKEFHYDSPPALMQQMLSGPQQTVLAGHDLQSMLDIGSLLKLNTAGDHMKVEREEVVDLIDELMSTDGVDYNFNLDDNEGVCDLFDVQILNY